ncbi:hypothetical protein NDU88_000438 [Pleurodeles waltl]|uniref:Uncharacterized protein n=1 Tax=Pleurodeles waltl TaxID=8319 RepID=A0AAV7MKV0_PLEWA|nr:hypothetical protein NDU88_000438 [Pleurodeles waltl]
MCGARLSRMSSRVTPCVAYGRARWVPALPHVWRTAERGREVKGHRSLPPSLAVKLPLAGLTRYPSHLEAERGR